MKLGELSIYLKPVEQTLYSATAPIKKIVVMYIYLNVQCVNSNTTFYSNLLFVNVCVCVCVCVCVHVRAYMYARVCACVHF